MLAACMARILFPKAHWLRISLVIIVKFVSRDKPLWTKSIFSGTFPVLQKLSKSTGYPGWRTIFQRYLVGIIDC